MPNSDSDSDRDWRATEAPKPPQVERAFPWRGLLSLLAVAFAAYVYHVFSSISTTNAIMSDIHAGNVDAIRSYIKHNQTDAFIAKRATEYLVAHVRTNNSDAALALLDIPGIDVRSEVVDIECTATEYNNTKLAAAILSHPSYRIAREYWWTSVAPNIELYRGLGCVLKHIQQTQNIALAHAIVSNKRYDYNVRKRMFHAVCDKKTPATSIQCAKLTAMLYRPTMDKDVASRAYNKCLRDDASFVCPYLLVHPAFDTADSSLLLVGGMRYAIRNGRITVLAELLSHFHAPVADTMYYPTVKTYTMGLLAGDAVSYDQQSLSRLVQDTVKNRCERNICVFRLQRDYTFIDFEKTVDNIVNALRSLF